MVIPLFLAVTLRVFGSAGAEAALTPPNNASPLNPNNVAAIPYSTNTADANTIVEVMPEDKAWKFRLKARADASDRAADHIEAGEALLQLNPKPWLDLTAGRVIEKWGTGYAWNPTSFIGPKKNPADPNDRLSAYTGLEMLKTDLFVRGTNISLYALQHAAFAARVYRLVNDTDISLVMRRDRNGTQQGIALARVFGDALELHAEAARRKVLLGGQYTFKNSVNVVAELYRSGDGGTATEMRSVCQLAENGDLLDANARYSPLQMARNYSFLRGDLPFGKNDVELITITNLRDRSSIIRATYSCKLSPRVNAYLIETEFAGKRGSEFALIQIARQTIFGLRVYF
ncbi:MAG TPA: hypothetical protein VGR95_19360 [Thermoanaerobaculia bacterium]|jgi:hypothetical protein|nr:hypothetical protein [Thermoanaerobaculia bacterium]